MYGFERSVATVESDVLSDVYNVTTKPFVSDGHPYNASLYLQW